MNMMEVLKCRACLNEKIELVYLFTKVVVDETEIDYATMMMNCSEVEINESDDYSKGVCYECFESMKQAYTFKKLCEKSYNLLKNSHTVETNDLYPEDDTLVSKTFIDTDDLNNINNILSPDEFNLVDEIKTNSDNITCEHCNKSFKRLDNYTKHLAKHGYTSESQKRYKCHLCEKTFSALYGLKYHIECHKGIKQHKCDYENCEWSFISKHALEKHAAGHTGDEKFLCNVCGKGYSRNDSLSHHMKTHSGLRPYKCTHCEKSYTQSCHLKKHVLVHEGSRPYTCESCGRSYYTSHQLKVHFRKFCGQGLEPVFKFKKSKN